MGYIRVPIETNPETLSQDIFSYIQAQQPGWIPNDSNLDTWIIRAVASKAAENRTLASDVPDDIFASFGSSIMAFPPIDAVAATGNTTWNVIDTNGHTIPAGTFLGLRNDNGDLVTFQTVIDVVIAPGDISTAVGEVLIQAVETGTDANGLDTTPELITVIDWVTTILIGSPTGGGVEAETFDAYLDRLTRKMQSLSTVPILPPDFANAALDADPGVYRAVAIDLYNPLHNLLTLNEASAETDATGYVNLANSAVSSTSAQAASGTKSVALTSVAGGDMNAILNREIPVLPGNTITVRAEGRTAVSARAIKVGIRWIDASHATISTVYGSTANDSTSAFTLASHSAVAPSNAAYCKLVLFVTATGGASEVHYFDKMSLRHGTATDWVAGGTAETNNEKTITVAAVDSAGAPVSSGIKTSIFNYITALRETGWNIHVMDAKYTSIAVAVSIKVLTGFDPASVETSVETALANYLASNNWATDPGIAGADAATTWVESETVYYNELIALVSGVSGVDRVTDLTCNITGQTPARVDVALDSPASLTTPGTITATAV